MFEVRANDIDFACLEAGSGPLALCLHGFPDTAHTWRYLLPALADAGFHAVAPFTRGYHPTSIPSRPDYSLATLATDANALHAQLDGRDDAVLIGHDWGAETAYAAAAAAPSSWRRVVALAVPPASLDPLLDADPEQRRRFEYLDFLASARADDVDDRYLRELWRRWSPSYDPSGDLDWVAESLADLAHRRAAVSYYADNRETPAATAQRRPACPQPTLYLHGADDGCIRAGLLDDVDQHLVPGSSARIVGDAGHFLHLERPETANWLILDWVSRA